MILRRTRLCRKTPIRPRRPTLRRGELNPAEKSAAREFIYELSGGRCELRFPGCMGLIWLPYDGDVYHRWHLVHDGAKRRFGWPVSGPRRMRGGCYHCHEMLHRLGPKLCPLPPLNERNQLP